jgi:hypothetical protein
MCISIVISKSAASNDSEKTEQTFHIGNYSLNQPFEAYVGLLKSVSFNVIISVYILSNQR